jgi:D-3-phosphoglycerate dehydrogenase
MPRQASSEQCVQHVLDFWQAQLAKVLPDRPDLVLLPEICDMPTAQHLAGLDDYLTTRGNRVHDFIADIASKHRCYITYSSLQQREQGGRYNTMMVIDRNGNIAGRYNKRHVVIDEYESWGVEYGSDTTIIECDFGRVACAICFDLYFDDARRCVAETRPDLVLFSSMVHGGMLQAYWAYCCRAHLVAALHVKRPSAIYTPTGEILANTTNYFDYVTANVNLDCAVFHLDNNRPKLEAAKAKYGAALTVRDPGYLGAVLLTCESDDFSVQDIAREFELETLDDYLHRSLEHRRQHGKPQEQSMTTAAIVATGPINDVVIDILKPYATVVVASDTAEESLMAMLAQAKGLIVRGIVPISERVINSATHLQVIGRTGAGYDNVDIAAATARKIPVVYTPGANDRAVAEAAVAMMLALCKQIPHWDRQLKAGNWQSRFESTNRDLDGATLGIIGFGRIGQSLARLIQPFNMTVLAYDPHVPPAAAQELNTTLVGIDDLLAQSDFISIHAALMDQSRGLINRDRLRLVKRGAFLINLARGELIESLDVLHEALTDDRLAGVGLDVFAPEPPDVHHPIFKLPNCLTAPHALGMTQRAMSRIFKSMAEDMAAVFSGRRPQHVVNSEVLT